MLVACGGSGTDSSDAEARRAQDMWEIDQIEKDFHEATTTKDIDLMMSLYAPNATMTVGPGRDRVWAWTRSGNSGWTKSPAFEPAEQLGLRSPRLQARDHGERRPGTLHFECHYVDVETGEVVCDHDRRCDVARIDGKWLITNIVGGTTEL